MVKIKSKKNKGNDFKKERLTILFSLLLSLAGASCFYTGANFITGIFNVSEPAVLLILITLWFGTIMFGLMSVLLLVVLVILLF